MFAGCFEAKVTVCFQPRRPKDIFREKVLVWASMALSDVKFCFGHQ